jgi:hypothetical protein
LINFRWLLVNCGLEERRRARPSQRRARLTLTLMAALLAGFVSQAYGQGCAMCLTGAMSQGVEAIKALNLGILVLMVPPVLFTVAVFGFLFLRRS